MSDQENNFEVQEQSLEQQPQITLYDLSNQPLNSYNSVKGQNQLKHEEQLQENSNNKVQQIIQEDKPRPARQRMRGPAQIRQVKQQKMEDITLGMQIINLDRYLFNGIVQLCRRENLISEDMAHSFLTNHTIAIDKKYILLYKSSKLNEFDFAKCKINIIDHRRLTEMLVNARPQKYKPLTASPYDFSKETQQFLKQIYALSLEDYDRQLQEQTIKYCQSWWGGPQKISPLVDPPLKFYETEEGQKIRIEREKAIVVETAEQQRERSKRIAAKRTTNQDLKDIGKSLVYKFFGQKVKVEDSSESKSVADSTSEVQGGKDKQASKNKKHKKDKKIKKQKKDKDKKKDKKKNKKHKNSKPKKEAVDPKQQANSQPQGMQLYEEQTTNKR